MSHLQFRSTFEDNSMTNADEESFSDNETDRKSSDFKSGKSAPVNKNSDDYRKRRQRNNEGVYDFCYFFFLVLYSYFYICN